MENEYRTTRPGLNVEEKATSVDQFDGSEFVSREHYEDSANETVCGTHDLIGGLRRLVRSWIGRGVRRRLAMGIYEVWAPSKIVMYFDCWRVCSQW